MSAHTHFTHYYKFVDKPRILDASKVSRPRNVRVKPTSYGQNIAFLTRISTYLRYCYHFRRMSLLIYDVRRFDMKPFTLTLQWARFNYIMKTLKFTDVEIY